MKKHTVTVTRRAVSKTLRMIRWFDFPRKHSFYMRAFVLSFRYWDTTKKLPSRKRGDGHDEGLIEIRTTLIDHARYKKYIPSCFLLVILAVNNLMHGNIAYVLRYVRLTGTRTTVQYCLTTCQLSMAPQMADASTINNSHRERKLNISINQWQTHGTSVL